MLERKASDWLRSCVALLAMLLVCMAVSGQAASASTPAFTSKRDHPYKLVYEAWEGEHHDRYHIYVADFDGSHPRMVSGNAVSFPKHALWSPDGKKIAFVAGLVGGEWQIPTQVYVVNADGSMLHLLQHDPNGIDYAPGSWSPDGLHLITVHGLELDVIDLQGKILLHKTALPDHSNNGIYDYGWSPDGRRIIIVSAQDLDIVDLQGNVLFHNSRSSDQNNMGTVVWSPDGQTIAYWSHNVLYVMNADGSNLRQVANTDADLGHDVAIWPVWSPDSKNLAFTPEEGRQGQQKITLINADGSNKHLLAGDVADQFGPEWSPDGKQITYSVGGDIHLINTDGSNDRALKTAFGGVAAAAWSPDGQFFLYEFSDPGDDPAFVAHIIGADGTNDHALPDWTIDASWQPVHLPAPSSVAELASATSTATATLPPTSTPGPTHTQLPTQVGCTISADDLSNLGGNELFWNLQNNDSTTTAALESITLIWQAAPVGEALQTVVVNEDAIWMGNESSSPATVKAPWIRKLTLGPGKSVAVIFQFKKRLDLTPGRTYTASATFDNGCHVNSSFVTTRPAT